MGRIRLPRKTTSIRAHPHRHQNHRCQSKHLDDQDQHSEEGQAALLLSSLIVLHAVGVDILSKILTEHHLHVPKIKALVSYTNVFYDLGGVGCDS